MKKNKEHKITKLNNKKYTIIDIFSAFCRQFLYFFIIVLMGVNVGVALYSFVVTNTYSTECKISFSKKLESSQVDRIQGYIICNESIDKYVPALVNAGVLHSNSNFTFKELSDGLSSSIDTSSTLPTFTIRFSYTKKDYSYDVLKVVANKACQELNTIYTNGTFTTIDDSFVGETLYTKKNTNYLITPIAISIMIGFASIFIIDGLENRVCDKTDAYPFCENIVCYKKSKNKKNRITCLPKDKTNIVIINNDDVPLIKEAIKTFKLLPKQNVQILNENDAIDNQKSYIFLPFNKVTKVSKNFQYSYMVVKRKSNYSNYYEANNYLISKKIKLERIIYIDYKFCARGKKK